MEEFRFPGPGGLSWTHRVKTFGMSEIVSEIEAMRAGPDFAEYKARRRAHEIGAHLLAGAATHRQTDRQDRKEHEWRISVVMPDQNRNYFAEQIEEEKRIARNAGVQQAIDDLLAKADCYAKSDGPCADIIAKAFRQQALVLTSRIKYRDEA